MTTIIMRSALVYYGHKPPPEVAKVVIDWRGVRHVVTWAEVLDERRQRQARILANRRQVGADLWRAVRLWVAYFDQNLMGGWHAFLDGLGAWGHKWVDRDGGPGLRERLMGLFPVAGRLPGLVHWDEWKPLFAAAHERRRQDRRPVGVALLWQRGNELSLTPGQRSP